MELTAARRKLYLEAGKSFYQQIADHATTFSAEAKMASEALLSDASPRNWARLNPNQKNWQPPQLLFVPKPEGAFFRSLLHYKQMKLIAAIHSIGPHLDCFGVRFWQRRRHCTVAFSTAALPSSPSRQKIFSNLIAPCPMPATCFNALPMTAPELALFS